MTAPAIIIIILYSIDQFFVAYQHGNEKGKYNFWESLIAKSIFIGLLLWGGFFN